MMPGGRLRTTVWAAIVAVILCLISCSSEQPQELAGAKHEERGSGSETGGTKDGSKSADRPEAPAALVPIAHLGSMRENVSMQGLSEARGLAVARGSREEADELVGGADFEGFASVEAVIEHVSRTPGALGLVPWDEVGPRVKALSVEGESLLEPDAPGTQDYPLGPEGATVPEPEKLRRMVVGGDIVFDRGQYYVVIRRRMGIDFPLDGGYAAITSRVPAQSAYSETGIIHQFTAGRIGNAGAVRE